MSQPSKVWPAWIPLASVLALVLPAAVAVGTHQLFLFASLGPTAVMAAQQPENPSTHPYNSFAGHALGLLSGCVIVWVFGLSAAPSVFQTHQMTLLRAGAGLAAVLLAAVLELLLKAKHPPAAATTLLVALGAFRADWHDAGVVLGGVVLVTLGTQILKQMGSKASSPDR